MLLVEEFRKAVKGINPLRILHVGAHEGQESSFYNELNPDWVMWVEANYELMPKLRYNIHQFKNQECINTLLSDKNGEMVKFYISNCGAQSSSILTLKEHLISHPEVQYVSSRNQVTETIDEVFSIHDPFDVWNLDVQGVELKVIKGGLKCLPSVKVIYSEVNFREMYTGCALLPEFDEELKKLGFERMALMESGSSGWGDGIWTRKQQ